MPAMKPSINCCRKSCEAETTAVMVDPMGSTVEELSSIAAQGG